MTPTPTQIVRAALEYAQNNIPCCDEPRFTSLFRELENMIVVPIEPTDEMIEDAARYFNTSHDGSVFVKTYKAMISRYAK